MIKAGRVLGMLVCCSFFLGCQQQKDSNTLIFGVTPDYPPFEYQENGELKGFDIDLARLVADQLKKTAVFESMPFNGLLLTLNNGSIDAAISTVAITPEREKQFDFSDVYHTQALVMVHLKTPPLDVTQLADKTIACQLGTTMEIWLKKNSPGTHILSFDNNNQAIEALKAGHAQGALVDSAQGRAYARQYPEFLFSTVAQSGTGCGIVLKKNSPLRRDINSALRTLKKNGELKTLQKKWLGSAISQGSD